MRRAWSHTRWGRHGHAPGADVHAALNHGRWILRCVFCPSAAAYTGQDRFLCAECGNAAAGGRYCNVVLPPVETARRIAQLVARRETEHRNWEPGEPLEILEAENIEHGLAA